MNELSSSFGRDLAFLKHCTPTNDSAAHGPAEGRTDVRAESMKLEQALARDRMLGIQVDQREVGVEAFLYPPLAREAEALRRIRGRQLCHSLGQGHIEQDRKRRLHAGNATPDA